MLSKTFSQMFGPKNRRSFATMKRRWKICTTALGLALFIMLVFSMILGNAKAALNANPFDLQEVETGTKVKPVRYATATMEQMVQRDEEMQRLGFAQRIVERAPWLPVPHDLPVPPGVTSEAQSEAEIIPPAQEEIAPLAPALAASFEALPDNGTFIPPDTNGAVGPNHLMVPLNSQVRIQTKAGAVLSTVSTWSFWSSLGVIDVFDPKAIYDPNSSRFIFVACAERRSANSSMLLAVSATSDPTGLWYLWQLDGDASDAKWVDYPNIGVNSKWITFTSNMYNISNDGFAGVNIWVVDKASALDGGGITTTLFFKTGFGGTHVPCLTYSPTEQTQYLVNSWNSVGGFLRLYTITGTAASPIWTATALYPASSAWNWNFPGAPQSGSVQTIETNDDRLINAQLRNGSLWCTHTVALPASGIATRTAAKWWQINPISGAVVQSGVVQDTVSGMFYYFPSIAVNQYDEVMLGFTGSSPTTYAGCYYTYRAPETPTGTMQAVSLMKAGEASYYKTYGGTRNRWGDFSATCVDPTDDSTLWTIQEYADTPANMWGTWWGKLASTPPSTATISLSTNSLSNSCVKGTDAANQSFEVWNSGEGTLDYTISDNAYWLSCTPNSGDSSGEHDTIVVSYATSGMSLGSYSAVITVRAPNSTNKSQTLNVSLKIASADLTRIDLVAPWNGSTLYSPPTFSWMVDGGLRDAFDVNIGYSPTGPWYSTYAKFHKLIYENSWTMPTSLWNNIPSGKQVYWRVRGTDLNKKPRTIIISTQVWSFYKE